MPFLRSYARPPNVGTGAGAPRLRNFSYYVGTQKELSEACRRAARHDVPPPSFDCPHCHNAFEKKYSGVSNLEGYEGAYYYGVSALSASQSPRTE